MIYNVLYPNDNTVVDSRFASWDGVIVETTPGLKGLMGKTVENAIVHLRSQGLMVEVQLDSANKTELYKPTEMVMDDHSIVTMTRSEHDSSNED